MATEIIVYIWLWLVYFLGTIIPLVRHIGYKGKYIGNKQTISTTSWQGCSIQQQLQLPKNLCKTLIFLALKIAKVCNRFGSSWSLSLPIETCYLMHQEGLELAKPFSRKDQAEGNSDDLLTIFYRTDFIIYSTFSIDFLTEFLIQTFPKCRNAVM